MDRTNEVKSDTPIVVDYLLIRSLGFLASFDDFDEDDDEDDVGFQMNQVN